MSDVQDSIAVERARKNSRKPSWLTTNIIMAYSFLVVEEDLVYIQGS